MQRLIVSLDIGTSSAKAAVFTSEGKLLSVKSRPYAAHLAEGGVVEVPADEYWRASAEAIRSALDASGEPAGSVSAIGVSSQSNTFVVLDADCKPLRDTIVWLDTRATAQEKVVAEQFERKRFHRTTGIHDITAALDACKLLWLRENEPKLFRRARWFLLLEDFALFRMTGEFVSESSVWSLTGLLELGTRVWWPEMIDWLEVPEDRLPRLARSGEQVGRLSHSAADDLGLPQGISVVTGALDQVAGALGAGNIAPGMVTETTGTALAIIASAEKTVYDPLMRFPCVPHALTGLYAALPYCQSGGLVFQWFGDSLAPGSSLEELVAEGAKVAAGAEGLVVVPHVAGASCPEANAAARGAFVGIDLHHTRAHLVRATLESVAFLLKENLGALLECGVLASGVVSLGGGAKSPELLQIKADTLGLPIKTLKCSEATSLGTAILAAAAVGIIASVREGAEKWVRPGREFRPNPADYVALDEAFNRYLDTYRRLYGGKEAS